MKAPTTAQLFTWLEDVKDPEIPVLSLIDLGVITAVRVEGRKVFVEMTPTFVGCPALDIMKHEIQAVLRNHGVSEVAVNVSYREPWSSDKISQKGRLALKEFGLAPPPPQNLVADLEILEHVPCPRCNHTNTELRSIFGTTLCRSIHYCQDCHETFEQFKPL